jgi:hypothetical protein
LRTDSCPIPNGELTTWSCAYVFDQWQISVTEMTGRSF